MKTIIIALSVVFVIAVISDAKAEWMFINEAEIAAEWTGGSLETDAEFIKQGEGSIKWEHAINTGVRTSAIPTDWSEYTHFSMSIYSEKITNSEFVAIIESPNGAVDGMDYWKIAINPDINNRIKIDWEGSWQDFRDIPFADMAVVRQPLGFDQITQVSFSATWDNWIPDPDAVLYIDDMYVTDGTPRPEIDGVDLRAVNIETALATTWGKLKMIY